jgi:hypothetical protein
MAPESKLPPAGPGTEPEEARLSGQKTENRLKFAGEVVVDHHAKPPAGPPDLKVHKRQPLPLVPTAPGPPLEKDKERD